MGRKGRREGEAKPGRLHAQAYAVRRGAATYLEEEA
jgi:hypothetical protein